MPQAAVLTKQAAFRRRAGARRRVSEPGSS